MRGYADIHKWNITRERIAAEREKQRIISLEMQRLHSNLETIKRIENHQRQLSPEYVNESYVTPVVTRPVEIRTSRTFIDNDYYNGAFNFSNVQESIQKSKEWEDME